MISGAMWKSAVDSYQDLPKNDEIGTFRFVKDIGSLCAKTEKEWAFFSSSLPICSICKKPTANGRKIKEDWKCFSCFPRSVEWLTSD